MENLIPENFGYALLFVYSLKGGYVGVIAAGVLSAMGEMNLWLCFAFATLGNIFGSCILAYLARYKKPTICGYLKKHRRKLALVGIWLKKYGIGVIFGNKYVFGLKTATPIAIGISGFCMRKFLLLNALACALWAIVGIGFGFYASGAVLWAYEKMMQYPFVMPVFMSALFVTIFMFVKVGAKKSVE